MSNGASSPLEQVRELSKPLEESSFEPPLDGTRLKLLKSLVLRVLRVHTRPQHELNERVARVLGNLAERVLELEKLKGLPEELRALVAAQAKVQGDLQGALDRESSRWARETEQTRARMDWLVQWTDQFRKELFFEVRHRLEEHERLTNPEILDRTAYQLKVRNMPQGLKVNLGAGDKSRSEFLNVDQRSIEGIDIRADVRHLPFEDGQLAELYCAHLIEHFTDAEMRSRILPYWFRLLRRGGKLVVVCPDADAMIRAWLAGKMKYDDLREVTFGGQEYEGNTHYNMFTPESLEQLLTSIGFTEVRQVATGRPNGKCLEMEFEAIK